MLKEVTLEEVRARAARAGLTRLTEEHVQQLLQATQAAQRRRAVLPTANLTPADEPSHVFRLRESAER